MSNLSGVASQFGSKLQDTSAATQTNLGARGETADGRVFRYVKNGSGAALIAGNLVQAPAEITNHQDLTPTAAAVGATEVTVTLGATAATVGMYTGGYLIVTADTGAGYQYEIATNAAAIGGATCVITLVDPLIEAIDATSNIDLVACPYNGVIILAATPTSTALGVAVSDIPASHYGWIQTGGNAVLKNDAAGGVTVGNNVCGSNAVAGAIELSTGTQPTIGIAVTGIAASENGQVKLILE